MKPPIVYFIQACSGPIKIGLTGDLIARFSTLQVGNHETLTLLAAVFGGRQLEADLQARFARHLIRGEWFQPDDAIVAYIAELPQDIGESFRAAWSGRCSKCGGWHRNLINTDPGRYLSLCRRCIMELDGRLVLLGEAGKRANPPEPKKPCRNCGREAKPLRNGRCGMCSEHLRKTGAERPPGPVRGRLEQCKRGHAFDAANTATCKNGSRYCKACRYLTVTERRARLKETAALAARRAEARRAG